jgi:hypothetical protein
MRGTIFAWRQADGMYHHQIDGRAHGPGSKVGRRAAARVSVPALCPQGMGWALKHASCVVAQLVLFAAKYLMSDTQGSHFIILFVQTME